MSSRTLPPLTWLRAFDAAARHLSFTLAAQELNLTQSAVSQHVRNLEDHLGRDLFVRRTRALQLTESGANYLPTVREAFDVLARGTRSFIGGDSENTLILQCNMAFSVFWLAPRLHRLYAAHPWLVLNVVTALWDPDAHGRDAAMKIRFGRPGDMSGDATRLTSDVCRPVCHPEYMGGVPGFLTRFFARFLTRVFDQGLGDRNIQLYSTTRTEKYSFTVLPGQRKTRGKPCD